MREMESIQVKYHGRWVGTIARTKDGKGAFQYDKRWLAEGFSVSPFSLPLSDRVFVPRSDILEGLFGVFSFSLAVLREVQGPRRWFLLRGNRGL